MEVTFFHFFLLLSSIPVLPDSSCPLTGPSAVRRVHAPLFLVARAARNTQAILPHLVPYHLLSFIKKLPLLEGSFGFYFFAFSVYKLRSKTPSVRESIMVCRTSLQTNIMPILFHRCYLVKGSIVLV